MSDSTFPAGASRRDRGTVVAPDARLSWGRPRRMGVQHVIASVRRHGAGADPDGFKPDIADP